MVEVSGFHWLKGEKKVLTFANLVTNCLCTNHNSALSKIDSVGGRFFAAFQKCCTTDSKPSLNFLFSGHDIERWLLRTLAASAVSNNLSANHQKLESKIHPKINFAEMLQHPTQWKRPLGMYTMQPVGNTFTQKAALSFGPILMIDTNEIVGFLSDIQGFHVSLLAADQNIEGTGLERGFFRPGKLIFKLGDVTHSIQFSWQDELDHEDVTLGLLPQA